MWQINPDWFARAQDTHTRKFCNSPQLWPPRKQNHEGLIGQQNLLAPKCTLWSIGHNSHSDIGRRQIWVLRRSHKSFPILGCLFTFLVAARKAAKKRVANESLETCLELLGGFRKWLAEPTTATAFITIRSRNWDWSTSIQVAASAVAYLIGDLWQPPFAPMFALVSRYEPSVMIMNLTTPATPTTTTTTTTTIKIVNSLIHLYSNEMFGLLWLPFMKVVLLGWWILGWKVSKLWQIVVLKFCSKTWTSEQLAKFTFYWLKNQVFIPCVVDAIGWQWMKRCKFSTMMIVKERSINFAFEERLQISILEERTGNWTSQSGFLRIHKPDSGLLLAATLMRLKCEQQQQQQQWADGSSWQLPSSCSSEGWSRSEC